MAVIAKMVVAERTDTFGSHYPPEHFIEDHWFSEMERSGFQACDCEKIGGQGKTSIILRAVYSREVGHENHLFWQATPSAEFKLTVENLEAADYFEPGVEYFVEIRKARS